jgi:hypothetical protein
MLHRRLAYTAAESLSAELALTVSQKCCCSAAVAMVAACCQQRMHGITTVPGCIKNQIGSPVSSRCHRVLCFSYDSCRLGCRCYKPCMIHCSLTAKPAGRHASATWQLLLATHALALAVAACAMLITHMQLKHQTYPRTRPKALQTLQSDFAVSHLIRLLHKVQPLDTTT